MKQTAVATHQPGRSNTWSSLVILTLFTLLTFVNSWPDTLVYDDKFFVGPDSTFQLESMAEAFTRDVWDSPDAGYSLYRPLLMIDFELQSRLFGAWNEGYHLANMLLHLVIVLTLFGFLRYLLRTIQPVGGKPDLYALLGALVFAIHPVHTEVVNSVFNKSSLYVSLAAVCGLWWLLSNLEKRPSRAWVGFGLVFCVAILFKESALVLPGIAAAMIVLLTEGSLKVRIRRFLPVFLLLVPIVVYFWARELALAPAQSNPVTAPAELITALGVTQPANVHFQAGAFALFGQGLKILAWPYPLRLHYGEPGDAAFAIYIAIQILLGGWAIYLLAKGRPILAFSLVFYYLALLPSVHLLGFGDPHMSERYLYFPSVGMTLALAFGFRSVATRLGRKNLSMIMLPILLALAAISWGRNADWNSESQLFETEYQFGDRGSRTLRNLAAAHFDNGRFQRVVEICDENPSTVIKYIKFTLGCANSYSRVARTDDAIDVLDRFVRSDESEGSRITARLTMASIYLARKQYQQVAGQYMVIIEQVKKPSHKEMYKGELLLLLYPDNKEQLEIARRLFQQAIEKDPGLIAAQKRIKQVNERLAKIDSASHSSDSN